MLKKLSVIKRNRQNETRRIRNVRVKSNMRTAIKKLNVAIDTRDADAARQELKKVIPVVDKAATKGVIHKNNASRKISRLTSKVDSMAAPE